jgi:[acyl-carrier-protein] S-malonyltransferase
MVSGTPHPGLALLFPGQGSQSVGMGRAICGSSPAARTIFERADRALDMPLSRICFEGPEEDLRLTANTQPAILTTSLALLAAMKDRLSAGWMRRVVCAAGHSLGEYSALVAAGALDLEDAVRTVRRRGEYMQEAVPVGHGAMAAVLGAALPDIEALCREAAEDEVLAPANLNGPQQTVVAGTASAVERLAALAKTRGIRGVRRLPVSAPFHCALMAPAQKRLAGNLKELSLRDADFPVICNVDARPERDAGRFRTALEAQVTAPVRWVETVHRLLELGVETVIEVGPGRVLSGLASKIAPGITVCNVEDPESLDRTLDVLGASAPPGDRS